MATNGSFTHVCPCRKIGLGRITPASFVVVAVAEMEQNHPLSRREIVLI